MNTKITWECPYCQKGQTIDTKDWQEYRKTNIGLWHEKEDEKDHDLNVIAIRCRNDACSRFTIKAYLLSGNGRIQYDDYSIAQPSVSVSYDMKPQSSAKPQPGYIPKPIVEDYEEACLIKNLSPKASAALCRRCLQGMIRDFWGVKADTLYNEINKIEEKCDPEVWQSIDAIREIGNIGAHMQKDVNVIVEVEADEAEILIQLIEQLFEEWYTFREKRKRKLEAALALKEAKKEQKKKFLEDQKNIENSQENQQGEQQKSP